ncbi:MAG: hypothetical protein ACYT04_59170, partial [Nostoc sp.]
DQFSEDPRTGKLMWRDSASQISKQVAGLIDYLMEVFPGKRPQNAQMILRCLSEINSTAQSYSTGSSASQLPPTEIEKPKQSRQLKTSATTQIQSSKTETNIFSSKTAQSIGAAIGFAMFILIKFGSWAIHKPFQSHPIQPLVTSTSTDLQASNSEQANTDSTNQKPSISEENIPQSVPSGWKKFEDGGAELWLPPSWEGGDLSEQLYKSMNKSASHNPEIEQFAQQVQSNPSAFPIWAFDSNTSYSRFVTNVIVMKDDASSNTNLEIYSKELVSREFYLLNMKTHWAKGYQ